MLLKLINERLKELKIDDLVTATQSGDNKFVIYLQTKTKEDLEELSKRRIPMSELMESLPDNVEYEYIKNSIDGSFMKIS